MNPFDFNFIVLAMLIYGAYSIYSSRVGGSSFSSDDDSGSLGSGATVVKVQIGLDADWSDSGSIMRTLSDLSLKHNSVNSRGEISRLLSDAAIALLRKQSDWNSATVDSQLFNGASKAEPVFQRISVNERTKFEKETNGDSNWNSLMNGESPRFLARGTNTQAVVSLVVALRGKSDAHLGSGVRSVADVRKCLQSLASEALTDEGENVMGVEVLWTPSESGTVLTERDIIADYPELIKL